MTPGQFLEAYAAGWCGGNSEGILKECAEGYTLDNPGHPPVTKAGFAEYFRGLVSMVAEAREKAGAAENLPFMELHFVQAWTEKGFTVAWCLWAIPETPYWGAGLIEVSNGGVERETLFPRVGGKPPVLAT